MLYFELAFPLIACYCLGKNISLYLSCSSLQDYCIFLSALFSKFILQLVFINVLPSINFHKVLVYGAFTSIAEHDLT